MVSFGFSVQIIIWPKNNDVFIFKFFSFLISMSRVSTTMLNRSGDSVSGLKVTALNAFLLNIIFGLLFCDALYQGTLF